MNYLLSIDSGRGRVIVFNYATTAKFPRVRDSTVVTQIALAELNGSEKKKQKTKLNYKSGKRTSREKGR